METDWIDELIEEAEHVLLSDPTFQEIRKKRAAELFRTMVNDAKQAIEHFTKSLPGGPKVDIAQDSPGLLEIQGPRDEIVRFTLDRDVGAVVVGLATEQKSIDFYAYGPVPVVYAENERLANRENPTKVALERHFRRWLGLEEAGKSG